MSEFHVSRDGVSFGPYAEDQAIALFASGNIAPTDLVWREGMPTWREAAGLLGVNHPIPPPLVPPPVINRPVTQSAATPLNQPTSKHVASAQYRPVSNDNSTLLPPKLHWGLVLLFTVLTLGIFLVVWVFIQSTWIKKIDPTSNATNQFIGYVAMLVIGQVLTASGGSSLQGIGTVLVIGAYVMFYFAIFSMKKSMMHYYNEVEPIGLKLSTACLVFFSTFYFQAHMTRIAKWKTTGVLDPQ